MTDEQVKYMVDRFLGWRLPENFNPDAGISFKAEFNENTPYPMKHEPTGTNLFDATQAEAMVRYLVDGMPAAPEAEPRKSCTHPNVIGHEHGAWCTYCGEPVGTSMLREGVLTNGEIVSVNDIVTIAESPAVPPVQGTALANAAKLDGK
jgi:hypothetical protein